MSDYSYSDDDSSMASLSEESGSDDDELIEIENAFCEAEGAWLHEAYVRCMCARLVPPLLTLARSVSRSLSSPCAEIRDSEPSKAIELFESVVTRSEARTESDTDDK